MLILHITSRLCQAETAYGMLLKNEIQITSVIFFKAFIKSINVDAYCLYALIEMPDFHCCYF